jgi:glycerol-3-phosphate acyltransferase PlsY
MLIILIVFSYLLGSISSSIITAKIFNLPDPRTVGSNNAGATNMLRIGGKKVAIITLIFDILKGVIPVVIAKYLGFNLEEITLIGLFALIGHIFPVFFNFRGGKGVATFIGVLLTLNFYSGLIFVGIWLFVAKVLRISSISALIAAFFAPVYFYFFTQNVEATVIIICICLLIFITHRSNIKRLINQEEDNINAK